MGWGTAGVRSMNHYFTFGVSACGKYLLHANEQKPPNDKWPKCKVCIAALDRETRYKQTNK